LFIDNTSDVLKTKYKALRRESPAELLEKYHQICPFNMQMISSELRHQYKNDLDKFTLFVNVCLASMRDRFKKQEALCERTLKQSKNDQLLLQSLQQYEKIGLDFY
jgi:hypothetical protein